MKDNNENLNNELSNEAAEAVAGGARSDWSPRQIEVLEMYLDENDKTKSYPDEGVEYIVENTTPQLFLRIIKKAYGDTRLYRKTADLLFLTDVLDTLKGLGGRG